LLSRKTAEDALTYIILVIAGTISISPFLWAFMTSLKPADVAGLPSVVIFEPTSSNYSSLFEVHNFGRYFLDSVIVAGLSTLFSLVLGIPAAYSFARFKFRGSDDLAVWTLSIRMLPAVATIIPIYLIMNQARLLDNYLALIVTYPIPLLPLIIWILREFFKEVPMEIEEAAMVDGCDRLQAFYKITLPMAASGVSAAGALCFIMAWNEFFFALILAGGNVRTLPVAISGLWTHTGILIGSMSAAVTLGLIPALVLSFIIRKYLVSGLTFGALKG